MRALMLDGRLIDDKLRYQIAELSALPRAAVAVEDHYSQVFTRAGDRQLNRALRTVALTRLRFDPATKAYSASGTHRRGQNTPRDQTCLKRAIAGEVY